MSTLIERIKQKAKAQDTRESDQVQLAVYSFYLAGFMFIIGSLYLAGFSINNSETVHQSTWLGLLCYLGVGLLIGSIISYFRKYLKLKREKNETNY